MEAFFTSLLFWIGMAAMYGGTLIAPLFAPNRHLAAGAAICCFLLGGVVAMGTAVTKLAYEPVFATTNNGARAAYAVIAAAAVIATLKPSEIDEGQENANATETD